MRRARMAPGRYRRLEGSLIDVVWRGLSSPRAATINLLMLAGAILLVALLPQAPPGAAPGSAAYAVWLEATRPALGPLAPAINFLGGFRLLDTGWFRLLLAWLGVSLGVYVLGYIGTEARRRKGVRERGSGTVPRPDLMVHSHLNEYQAEFVAREVLDSLGYSVQALSGSNAIQAERHRAQRGARVLSHLGAGLLLLAAGVGAIIGWQEPVLAVAEGSTVPVGHGTGLSLRNEGFAYALYPDRRTARDYVTTLTVLRDGRPVVQGASLRVNSPVSYGGVRVHHAFYGPAVDLRVWDAAGRVVHSGGVPLTAQDPELRPAAVLLLDAYQLEVLAPRPDGTDAVVPPGSLRVRVRRVGTGEGNSLAELNLSQGERTAAGGLTLLFARETQYSGLHVTHNPAAPWAWTAGALMLGGVVYTFAFPYRRLLVRVIPCESGTTLHLRCVAGRPMGRTAELARVGEALQSALRVGLPAQAAGMEGRRRGGIA